VAHGLFIVVSEMTKPKHVVQRKKIEAELSKHLALRPKSLETYGKVLCIFSDETGIDLFDLPKLAEIEEATEAYIMRHRHDRGAKYLNVVFSAIKAWVFAKGLIKNRNQFKEISFDRSSRKTDALTEQPLTTDLIKKLFDVSDAHEKVLLCLYALCGLRPSLLPQLKVRDFLNHDAVIENGKLKFNVKNPFLTVPKDYEGNKAHITFFVILPSKATEYVEFCVNQNETVRPETRLLQKYDSTIAIHAKVKNMFVTVGFSGRPYLLRSFADRLLDKTIEDQDLKEFMMGHKGKISAIYQFRAPTDEDKTEYRKQYSVTERRINEEIFGAASSEQLNIAEATANFAQSLGVPKDQIERIYHMLSEGKLTLEAYNKMIREQTQVALQERMKEQVKEVLEEINGKQT
jgi:integrase